MPYARADCALGEVGAGPARQFFDFRGRIEQIDIDAEEQHRQLQVSQGRFQSATVPPEVVGIHGGGQEQLGHFR